MAGTVVIVIFFAAARSTPASGASSASATQRHGMITQKVPEGSDVMPGLSPSMRRRVGPMAMASARYPGANAITGGRLSPDMLTGTWMCVPVSSESRSVSVKWPGFSQVSRTYSTLFFDVLDRKADAGYCQTAMKAALMPRGNLFAAKHLNPPMASLLVAGLCGTLAHVMEAAESMGWASAA